MPRIGFCFLTSLVSRFTFHVSRGTDDSVVLLSRAERHRVPDRIRRSPPSSEHHYHLAVRRTHVDATNINFVAFSQYFHDVAGQVFVFFALTVAAAEVAVGLAIIIALYRAKSAINIDEFQLLKW